MANLSLIKELRTLTNAPLGDCKKALEETEENIEKAQERLKEKGVLKASKKGDRTTDEGVVKFGYRDNIVYGVKILCETDFVAKNDKFLSLVDALLERIYNHQGVYTIEKTPNDIQEELQKKLNEQVATIGEKLTCVGAYRNTGTAYVYNHMGNSISSVVWYEGDKEKAKSAALQLAAMNPTYLSMDDIPLEERNTKKKEIVEELEGSNKPDDIKNQIIQGRLYKQFKDDVLLEQESIQNPEKTVKQILDTTTVTKILRVTV